MLNSRIAKAINVSPSTVSREIRRNSGVRGRYNWETAQANAVQTKRRKPGNRSIDKEDVYKRQETIRNKGHDTIDEKDIGRLARASVRLQKIRKITSNSLFCWSFFD